METNTNRTYSLSDESIAAIAQLVQMAILTGTDVVDNLRSMKLEVNGLGSLDPTVEFTNHFNANIEKLLQSATSMRTDSFETR